MSNTRRATIHLRNEACDPFSTTAELHAAVADWCTALSADVDDLSDLIPETAPAWYPAMHLANLMHEVGKVLPALVRGGHRAQLPAPATAWRYGSDLGRGDLIRFRTADDSGWTPWVKVLWATRQITNGPDRYLLSLEGGLGRTLGVDETVQVLLSDAELDRLAKATFDSTPEATVADVRAADLSAADLR